MGLKLKVTVKKDTKGLRKLESIFKRLDRAVEVGFFNGKPHPKNNGEFTVAEVAAINEFGPVSKDLYEAQSDAPPSRPFFRYTIAEQQNWRNTLRKISSKMVKGQITPTEGMRILGARVQEDVQETIADNSFKDNSDKTIARKGENDPLSETGTMERSVRFRMAKKSKI